MCFYQKHGWLQSEITVYKHYNEKKTNRGKGGRLKDDEFSGLKCENFSGIAHSVFH